MKIEKNKKSRNKRHITNLPYKIISLLLLISTIVFLVVLKKIDLLPTKYITIVFIGIIAFDLLNIFLLGIKRLKSKIKKVLSVIMILAALIMGIGSFYICKTLGILSNNGDSKYKLEHYSVITLKSSSYSSIKDIEGLKIGYYKNSIGSKTANEYIEDKVKVDFEPYTASDNLASDLLSKKVKIIMVEDSIKNIMDEENNDFKESTKVIYTFTIKVKTESTLKDVNVTKQPFAIYISGIDTYGQINSVSRSDVNIVMVVNPDTKQILLISIPRDYYVQLHGTTGTKDKLTHAGIYGIDMSIKTIEDLLDFKINYYLKVNFTSVIDIVNALGGLDVYSEYTFVSYSGYTFKKGYNSVNGKQALDFARTRKAFSDGDRQRGKNQQALIEAIIRKASNKSIITKYNSLLSAIDGKYQTNMSAKKITSLVKMQLDDMSKWNITSYSLIGSDSHNYTYTYYQLLYVMEPDEKSVIGASELIDKVLAGESLDSSYGEMTGNSNKVGQVKAPTYIYTPPKQSTPETTVKEEEKETEPKIPEDDDENDANDDGESGGQVGLGNEDILEPIQEPADSTDATPE